MRVTGLALGGGLSEVDEGMDSMISMQVLIVQKSDAMKWYNIDYTHTR